MTRRVCTLLSICALLAGIALGGAFDAYLSAQAQAIRPLADHRDPPGFSELPDPDEVYIFSSLANLSPVAGGITSTVLITANGQTCEWVLPRGTTRNPFFSLGASVRAPVSIALGSLGDGRTLDTVIAAPASASDRPLSVFDWASPPSLRGTLDLPLNVSGNTSSGMRIALGDITGDRTPEFIASAGGFVHVLELMRDSEFSFVPFIGYSGPIDVSTGDLNGDGHHEILAAQEQGGELKAFEIINGQAELWGRGRPYGHGYNNGFRVAAFDFSQDGKAEIITAPMTGEPRVRVFDVSRPLMPVVVGDFVAFDQNRQGGVSVEAGFADGRPFIMASAGGRFRIFELGQDGRFMRSTAMIENPFQLFIDVFSGVEVFTPPVPPSGQANRR